jgi:hypothetical protein
MNVEQPEGFFAALIAGPEYVIAAALEQHRSDPA